MHYFLVILDIIQLQKIHVLAIKTKGFVCKNCRSSYRKWFWSLQNDINNDAKMANCIDFIGRDKMNECKKRINSFVINAFTQVQ